LANDLWAVHQAGLPGDVVPPVINLSLKFLLDGSAGEGSTSGARLVNAILSQMETVYRPEGFREGSVYCFLCESSDCEHSRPADPKAVFAGYGTNGKPEWKDFSSILLAAGDTRVDLPYTEKPVVVALAQDGEGLHAGQLPVFGKESQTHHLLGQVVAGYFQGSGRSGGPERYALSLQAVEYRSRNGSPRLDLNVVSGALGASGLTGVLTLQNNELLYATIAKAKARIAAIGRSAINLRTNRWYSRKFEGRVRAVLHDLARFLERSSFQHYSRTRHAREERTGRDRPIAAALKDVEHAPPEAFCVDLKNSTFVVIGPHNRTHVFTPEGRLVTSINHHGDEIRRKFQLRWWRQATAEEVAKFRAAVESFRRAEAKAS
jgi:hypothetical protein